MLAAVVYHNASLAAKESKLRALASRGDDLKCLFPGWRRDGQPIPDANCPERPATEPDTYYLVAWWDVYESPPGLPAESSAMSNSETVWPCLNSLHGSSR